MKNRRPLLSLIALLLCLTAFSQDDQSKIDKKALAAYNKAMEKAQDGRYDESIELLKEAVRRDGKYIDAYLSLAGIYGERKSYGEAQRYYEQGFTLDTNYTSDYRLPYSINLAGQGKFEQALSVINTLLGRSTLAGVTRKSAEYRKKTYQFAVDFARAHAGDGYVFAPKNLGDGINTVASEYFPSLPIDGKQMVFTRKLNYSNEDFFTSNRDSNTWRPAAQLTGNINTPLNEGALNISQDGQWLIFTGCERPGGYGSCDLYISYLTENGWSEALNLGGRINTDQWESQPSLSPDKRDLYFASRRPGGYGGSDLYVAHLQPNGRWSEPENLGPEINTSGDEQCPFIHADNQTFYFTSNGLPGYGDEDIFVIRKNAQGKWSQPQNLGYPINTIDREGTLFIAADSRTAYFASDRSDSKGGLDIYSFDMRSDIRPAKTLWIKGQVYDQKTRAGLPSAVELTELVSHQTISRVQTDEKGNYLITLPVGKDYAFNVNRKGYLFYSENYSLRDKSPDSTYQKNIPLQPIEVNAAIVLRNIFFDFNQYTLKSESQVELDKLLQLLQENPAVKIQVEGHTDNIGNTADNLKLSANRALAVVNYLTSRGIAAARLSSKGFGATKPIADNKTEEGRAQNRRTEIKVIGI